MANEHKAFCITVAIGFYAVLSWYFPIWRVFCMYALASAIGMSTVYVFYRVVLMVVKRFSGEQGMTTEQLDKLKELVSELRHADEMLLEYVYTNYSKNGPEGHVTYRDECYANYVRYLDELMVQGQAEQAHAIYNTTVFNVAPICGENTSRTNYNK